MPRTKTKRGGRPSKLAKLSVTDLARELDRRKGMLGSMQRRRDDLARELAAVDAEVASLEAIGVDGQVPTSRAGARHMPAKRGRRGRRGPRENSLPSRLQSLLRGRTMNVAQMAQAAKKAGHKSKSKDFRAVVARAIQQSRHVFRRVSRGQYTAK